MDDNDNRMIDAELTVTKSESLDDWWLIERKDHDGRVRFEPTDYGATLRASSRITNADIEGTAAEMLAIADAIESGASAGFRRCSAGRRSDGAYELQSPRNSTYAAVIPLESAQRLAQVIRSKVTP